MLIELRALDLLRDGQGLVNLMLVMVVGLIPVAMVTLVVGRWRSHRFVLMWAQAAGVVSTVLAAGYVVAGAVCLVLEERTPGADVTEYPIFVLPVGIAALLAALAILGGVLRTRWRLG